MVIMDPEADTDQDQVLLTVITDPEADTDLEWEVKDQTWDQDQTWENPTQPS